VYKIIPVTVQKMIYFHRYAIAVHSWHLAS